jgi:hypothetical protein
LISTPMILSLLICRAGAIKTWKLISGGDDIEFTFSISDFGFGIWDSMTITEAQFLLEAT